MRSNKTYVYNPKQANFYVSHGAKILKIGIHDKTHRTYWVFDFNLTTPIFHEWCCNVR